MARLRRQKKGRTNPIWYHSKTRNRVDLSQEKPRGRRKNETNRLGVVTRGSELWRVLNGEWSVEPKEESWRRAEGAKRSLQGKGELKAEVPGSRWSAQALCGFVDFTFLAA
jgi:hypothetical protein